MKPAQIAKSATRYIADPLETLNEQIAKPVVESALDQLEGFFGMSGKKKGALGQEDLARARQEERIDELRNADGQKSQESVQRVLVSIHQEYQSHTNKVDKEQQAVQKEVHELQSEVEKLARAAGVETRAHMQPNPKKLGVLDIKRLTFIVRILRLKAEDSKSAKDLVTQRSNVKRTTGMLAWVSGKQMKVHEQGTLQLQG